MRPHIIGDASRPWLSLMPFALRSPWEAYLTWIATLEEGSEARRKMEGVPKYGEIVIDFNHVQMLAHAFDRALAVQTPEQQAWQ